MGMYDEVWFQCPDKNCDGITEYLQTKATYNPYLEKILIGRNFKILSGDIKKEELHLIVYDFKDTVFTCQLCKKHFKLKVRVQANFVNYKGEEPLKVYPEDYKTVEEFMKERSNNNVS